MAENESTSSTASASAACLVPEPESKSRLRPPSKLKRPMATSTTNKDEKQNAPKKMRSNVGSAVTTVKPKKVTTRRSFCRVRNASVAIANSKKKSKPLSTIAEKGMVRKKKQFVASSSSTLSGRVGTLKSSAVGAATTTQNQTGSTSSNTVGVIASKKVKRPSWDIKGKLEDMTELYQRQNAELVEHKQKTKVLDDILRRLEMLEGEKQAIEVENTDQMSEISKLHSEQTADRLEIKTLQEKLRVATMDLDERTMELRKGKLEYQELDMKYHEEQRKNKALSEKLKALEEKCSASQDTNMKYEQEIKSYEVERKRLLNEVIELKGNIRVFCRVRPHIKDESPPDHLSFDGQGKSIGVVNGEKTSSFSFDKVFTCSTSQAEIFEELSQLVSSSLDGYNVCVFAYGQTGSGKTYTMEGPDDMTTETCGVIPRAMNQVFENSKEREKLGWEYTFHVEQLEIYCENVQDLLRSKNKAATKLEIKTKKPSGQAAIWVPDLSSHKVETYDQVKKLLQISKKRRATAATSANDYSSRSHSVFILRISASNTETGQRTECEEYTAFHEYHVLNCPNTALNLIDLAGSERCGSNGSSGIRFVEGTKINNSLTVLSTVITALARKDSHIPYRSSKLTLLLSDCLGGNSKTLMIVNINPSPHATSESINTLRFATTVNQCNIGTAQKVVKL